MKLKTEAKNLIHKKPYRTFMSTCFDINETASIANSLDLQSSNPSEAGQTKTLSLSESNLSLIVAAGFNKGEIHVFDCYKKEASVFYNNSVSVVCCSLRSKAPRMAFDKCVVRFLEVR